MTQPTNSANKSSRYAELDGLRGVAASGVVLYHVITLSQTFLPPEKPIPLDLQPLSLGVHLFFMISGFVIFFTTRRSVNVVDFAISRFSRLYPPFWVALIVTSLVGLASQLPWLMPTFKQFVVNLSMVPAVFGVRLVDGVYWTLYVEMFFYFLMAVLLGLGLIRRERLVINLATIWAVLSAVACIVYARMGHPDGLIGAIASGLIIEYAPLFATGMIALTMREQRKFDVRVVATVVSALVAGWAMLGLEHMLKVSVPIALFLIVTSLRSVPLLTSRPLQALGAVSYTWYLLHQNISYAIIDAIPNRWVAMAVAIVVTYFLAWLLHKTVETKVSPTLRRWLRTRMV